MLAISHQTAEHNILKDLESLHLVRMQHR